MFFLILMTTIACHKNGTTISFNISDNFDFTIKSGSLINIPFDILTPDITTNSNSEFEQNDSRADKITEIKLSQLQLSITVPNNKTFSFLKNVEIFISAPGLDEKIVASAYDLANNTRTLNLNCSSENFAEYVKKESYNMRVKTTTRETQNQDITLNANLLFKVKAKPLK